MSSTKINLIFLPLLFSILLSTLGKLKLGHDLNSLVYTLLTPVQVPLSVLKQKTTDTRSLIFNIPSLKKQNDQLKAANNLLLTENQNLKSLLHDQFLINDQKPIYQHTLPVRVLSINRQIAVTTTLDISEVKIGQPAISDHVLLGLVADIQAPIIYLTPLSEDNFPNIGLVTSNNQKGNYQYSARTPQMINLPSESPVNLNDTVFTQVTELIPGNLLVGRIVKVLTSKESPLQKVEIKLDQKPQDLKDLLIVTKP